METPRTIVNAWTELGQWFKGPGAPNGSVCGSMERHCYTRTVYLADYYGKGEKLYMDSNELFQTEYDRSPRRTIGGSSDGGEDRIKARMALVGAAC